MINDIKNKLPLGKKTRDEETDDLDGDGIDTSFDDDTGTLDANSDNTGKTTINRAPKKKASKSSSKDIDEDGPGKKSAPQSKPRMLAQGIAVCIVMYALSDYIPFLKDEGAEAPVVKPSPKAVKPKKEIGKVEEVKDGTPKEEVKTPEETPTDVLTETPTEVPTSSPELSTTPEATTPLPTETPPSTEPTPKPNEVSTTEETSPVSEPTLEAKGETVPPLETPIPITTTPEVTTPVLEEAKPSEVVTSEPVLQEPIKKDETTSKDILDEGLPKVAEEDNLTDQILLDLEKQAKETKPVEQIKEYVSPPDYEYRGRGLVYNCEGKHWACVDAPSYKKCEDNTSSIQYLKKKVECYPFNVYDSLKGCENMQRRMVSSSAKTNFCSD